MNITYHKLLDIQVTNTYFHEGICSAFKLIPLRDTHKVLRNYDLLIHKNLNVFSLYFGTSGETSFDLINILSNIDLLRFQLIVEDELFRNYTKIPNFEDTNIFYFENLENSNILQKGKYVSKEDIIEVRQKDLPKEIVLGSSNVEIRNEAGHTIQKNKDVLGDYMPINLRVLETGNYQLWVEDELMEFFFHFETLPVNNNLGIISLNIKNVIKKPNEVYNLTLDFEARKVFWQYQVVIPNTWNSEDLKLEILGIDNQIYKGPVEKRIVGGQIAMVFTSDQPESLHQNLLNNPILKISYSSNLLSRKNDLEVKLPNPGVENLYKINPGENDQSFCSTTIVYV